MDQLSGHPAQIDVPSRAFVPEPGLVNSAVYLAGRKLVDIAIDDAGEWARRPGHVVWIGLYEPKHDLLVRVQRQFNLHPLAIEDAECAHQQPKLEEYGDTLFVVARTAQMVDSRIGFGETHLFVGRGYVVSVRHGASCSYAPVRERCEAAPEALGQGEDYILYSILYSILDFIVDNYAPALEAITDEVEGIEDRVLVESLGSEDINRLYTLRRDLLRLRNAAGPLVREQKIASEPEALIVWFRGLGFELERIGLEAGPMSQWLYAAMRAAGLAVELLETRHVRDASRRCRSRATAMTRAGLRN